MSHDHTPARSKKAKTKLTKTSTMVGRIDKKNWKGETALQRAVIKGDVAKAASLISAGASVNCTDNFGWTLLHEASNKGNESIVKLLLAQPNVDVNTLGEREVKLQRLAPIHDAAQNGHMDICRILVENGANISLLTTEGLSPIDLADGETYSEVADFLRSQISSRATGGAIVKIKKSRVRGVLTHLNTPLKTKTSPLKTKTFTAPKKQSSTNTVRIARTANNIANVVTSNQASKVAQTPTIANTTARFVQLTSLANIASVNESMQQQLSIGNPRTSTHARTSTCSNANTSTNTNTNATASTSTNTSTVPYFPVSNVVPSSGARATSIQLDVTHDQRQMVRSALLHLYTATRTDMTTFAELAFELNKRRLAATVTEGQLTEVLTTMQADNSIMLTANQIIKI